MAISISNNLISQQTNRQVNNQVKETNKSSERLSSGLRINRPSDDAAGLAVAMQLMANSDLSSIASRNISDGVSLANVAEGALENVSDITKRMSELATQAANGVLSDQQRSSLNSEYQQLRSELDRISQSTEFNGQQLLAESETISIQAGMSGEESSQITLSLPNVSSNGLNLPSNISTQTNARGAINQLSTARDDISQVLSSIGSATSRFEAAYQNLQTSEINQAEAASRIMDADVGEEASNNTAARVRERAATAISAQANQLPNLAVMLLGQ